MIIPLSLPQCSTVRTPSPVLHTEMAHNTMPHKAHLSLSLCGCHSNNQSNPYIYIDTILLAIAQYPLAQ